MGLAIGLPQVIQAALLQEEGVQGIRYGVASRGWKRVKVCLHLRKQKEKKEKMGSVQRRREGGKRERQTCRVRIGGRAVVPWFWGTISMT